MSLTPKHWDDFQHYKDRAPSWIKLHRKLLDDFAFHRLPVASKALAPMLWLLASEYEHGKITATMAEIAFRLRTTENDVIAAVKPLIELEFFISDSTLLADCYQVAIPEKKEEKKEEIQERDRGEGEENARERRASSSAFDLFWQLYPNKVGKEAGRKAFQKIEKTNRVSIETLMSGLNAYVRKTDDRPWCNPATWLNQGRWDDQPAAQMNGDRRGKRPRSLSEVAAERVARAEEQERTLDLGPTDYCDTGVETGERSGR